MAEPSTPAAQIVRFGLFELNLRTGELRKAGTRIALQGQPLQVLLFLLDRAGDLVTREELRDRLWPGDTFVDFDHGLNAVINRLRETLGDSAETPRFVETLPRRGYRFIAAVERFAVRAGGTAERSTDGAVDRPFPSPGREDPDVTARVDGDAPTQGGPRWTSRPALMGGVAATVLLVVLGMWLRTGNPPMDGAPPKIVPLTNLAGKEDWPSFAPDGEQIAFAWSGETYENTDIYVTLVGSSSVRRLTTHPSDDYAPSWSPDGRRIAFLRKQGSAARIHVTSALGAPDAEVSDFPVGASVNPSLIVSHITWSPDGRYIVAGRDPRFASGSPAGLYLIPLERGQPRAITQPKSPTFDFSPAFSPDGRRLVYASCDTPGLFLPQLLPGRCVVRLVDLDRSFAPTGPPRTLTAQQVDPAGLAWSRDGKSIVFVGPAPRSVNLWRLWIDGTRAPEPIEIAGRKAEHPATVASRDRLVFSQYDWGAHVYRFRGTLPAERVAASSSSEGDPSVSPDGRRLAFTSKRSGHVAIWVSASDGSGPRQLTADTFEWQGSPSWSPRGDVIAFDAHDLDGHVHLWTVSADGGTPRQITHEAGDQTAPTWSQDATWVYYSGHRDGQRDLWRVRPGGGASERVTRAGTGFLGHESPDGRSVLYQPTYGDGALILAPLSGATPRTLVGCARNAGFAIGRRSVFYVACDPGWSPPLHEIDMVSGRDQLLGRLEHIPPDGSHVNLAVSPDGKTILFRGMVRRGGDLMLIENFR